MWARRSSLNKQIRALRLFPDGSSPDNLIEACITARGTSGTRQCARSLSITADKDVVGRRRLPVHLAGSETMAGTVAASFSDNRYSLNQDVMDLEKKGMISALR